MSIDWRHILIPLLVLIPLLGVAFTVGVLVKQRNAPPPHTDIATIAVASNFSGTARKLADDFAKRSRSGFGVKIAAGSSGQFATQIISHHTPTSRLALYDVFLSADTARPEALDARGLVRARKTYAIGQLALVGAEGPEALRGEFKTLAIANPDLAPYGQAAMDVLSSLGIDTKDRLAIGQNVSQAYSFYYSKNAELALVGRAQVKTHDKVWLVPPGLHEPIRQEVVLLDSGFPENAFFAYLSSPEARAIIKADGYDLPSLDDTKAVP